MKCDYCNAEDHLVTACGQKRGDRTFEAGGGFLVAVILSPFYAVGCIVGAISSAFMAGFRFFERSWPKAVDKIRTKKGEDNGEQGPV